MAFKPLLAETITDFAALRYPLVASPKLDGIRSINLGEGLVSRTLKPIPNDHVQSLFGGALLRGLDGELICGDPTAKDAYNKTYSAVMSKNGTPDVTFYVFDHVDSPMSHFTDRLAKVHRMMPQASCVVVEQRLVHDEAALLKLEEMWLEQGYEGVMVRSPNGRYKYGRSTEKEGILLKLKRMSTDEAEILAFQELLSNKNEAVKDALGHTKRSSHQENKVPMGTLGALVVKDVKTGAEFNIGTGFDSATRAKIWAERETWIGKIVSYNHFPIGVKDLPRFPSYKGLRSKEDM